MSLHVELKVVWDILSQTTYSQHVRVRDLEEKMQTGDHSGVRIPLDIVYVPIHQLMEAVIMCAGLWERAWPIDR